MTKFEVLMFLKKNKGISFFAKEISNKLSITNNIVITGLRKLYKSGFLLRTKSIRYVIKEGKIVNIYEYKKPY